jgi:adenylate kinase
MKIVLIGIQGAGKSTQGNLLSKQLKIPYLSTGHIFREIAKEKTQLGRYLKEILNSGQLVPDEKTIEIVNSYLSKPEYKKGYILDGFPRTLQQAKKFVNHVDKVIFLDLPEKDALWRIAFRNDTARGDETLPAIKKRIDLFNKVTIPVTEYYEQKGLLSQIDGLQSIEEINKDILKSLGRQLVKNQVQEWERKDKTIIAVAGLPGSGKTEATNFFKEKGLPVISFSRVINEYIDQHNLKHTEEVHKKLRAEFREKHGYEAFAVLNEEKIKKTLEKNMFVVIEGMRSWEEYIYLKKQFPKVKVVIVALYADKDVRYERLAHREYRRGLGSEERDINELIGTNMGSTIAFSDYLVKNNYSLDDLHDKLEDVYRSIYFS